jgi:hypothetical protein
LRSSLITLVVRFGNAAVYTDQNGNWLARFCMWESFVDCLDALLAVESRCEQALVSSNV